MPFYTYVSIFTLDLAKVSRKFTLKKFQCDSVTWLSCGMYKKLLINYFSVLLRKEDKVLTTTENRIKSCLKNCSSNQPANPYRIQKKNCSRTNFSIFNVFSQSSQNKNFDLINQKFMHPDIWLLFNNIRHTPFSVSCTCFIYFLVTYW